MGLINGLSGFGSGLGAFAGAAAEDAATTPARTPLLNATPAAAAESTPAAQTTPSAQAQAALASAASSSGGSVNVPADLLPIYQEAARKTGIPIDVLVAQAKQESGFDPNIVSSTGGIGLHQIQPSTARDPGYGLAPVDPATLKNPAVNIAFAAALMRAKAGSGADFNDPKTVDAALAAFNGGGDRNYIANVRRYMGAAS